MKKALLTTLFFVFAITAYSYAQAAQNFTLVNKTGLSIDSLFISTVDNALWEEDVLGQDILASGEECQVNFSPSEEACEWDLRIVDQEGDPVEWDKINLCDAMKVTLYWQDGKAWAEIENVQTEATETQE